MIRISTKQLAVYVADQLQSGYAKNKLVKEVASFLIAERRTRDIQAFNNLLQTEQMKRGITEVSVVSALPLSASDKQLLARKLGVKKPVFYEAIDETLIGGLLASTPEHMLDLSIKGKLKKLTQAGRA